MSMRILFLLLLFANLGFFAYHHLTGTSDEAAAQIALLQISPERISTVAAGTAVPASANASSQTVAAACVEWGLFGGAEVARADAALAALGLPADALQRRTSDIDGYWVHMPPLKTRVEADRKVGELKALGIEEFFVVQDAGPWRNAVSLGLFKNEEAARAELERLRQRGVRSATVVRREKLLKQVAFYVREPDPATVARLTELQRDFPATEIKAAVCPAAAKP
ncbi:MAG: SPOR domain-containing protein [Burkholderiales bacterium]|nr:SPOR domain-containing protein [Burkholderiales bacterium]